MINLVENSESLTSSRSFNLETLNTRGVRAQKKIKRETKLLLDLWVAEYKCGFSLSAA